MWFMIFVKHISGKIWGWLQLGSATEDLILAELHHLDYCTWAVGEKLQLKGGVNPCEGFASYCVWLTGSCVILLSREDAREAGEELISLGWVCLRLVAFGKKEKGERLCDFYLWCCPPSY